MKINLTMVDSFNVQVWVGLKEGYSGITHSIDEVYEFIQSYVNEVGQCFTVTPTQFIYKNGSENGVVIGLINYPRFPLEKEEIIAHASKIAIALGTNFKQNRVTITSPDGTIMIDFSDNNQVTK